MLINDSDRHLPVFTLYVNSDVNHKSDFSTECRQIHTEESIIAFQDLQTRKWDKIDQKQSVDEYERIFFEKNV